MSLTKLILAAREDRSAGSARSAAVRSPRPPYRTGSLACDPVELDGSNAVCKPSRRPLHETQRDSDIKHLLEQTGSPDSVVYIRIIEEHTDGSFLICRLKAIANELGQSEALDGGTSALAELGLPRAEERLRLQPPGMAIGNESLM